MQYFFLIVNKSFLFNCPDCTTYFHIRYMKTRKFEMVLFQLKSFFKFMRWFISTMITGVSYFAMYRFNVCFQAWFPSSFIHTLITGVSYFAMDRFNMLFQVWLCSYFLYTMIIEVSIFDMDRFNMLYQVWLSSCFIYTMITQE